MMKKKSQIGVTCLKKADLNHTMTNECLEYSSKSGSNISLAGYTVKRTF